MFPSFAVMSMVAQNKEILFKLRFNARKNCKLLNSDTIYVTYLINPK